MNTADLMRQRFQFVNDEVKKVSGGQLFAEVSKLRVEETLISGVGRYEFDIKKEGVKNSYEKTLNRNDVFVPTRLALFVAIQNDAKPAKEVLFSYIPVNDGENPSVHPVGFKTSDANAIYNGYLSWLIQNGVLMSSFPTERFKHVPQTQGLFSLNGEGTDVNQGIQSEFSIDNCSEVAIPQLIIAGTQDHKISVNFDGAGLDLSCTEGHTAKLVLYMDGFLVKGGCQYIDGNNAFAGAVGRW